MAHVPLKEAPILTDGVVTLDSYQLADVEAHLAGDDIENQKWLNDSRASSVETVTRSICDWRHDWQTDAPRRAWAIRDPASRTLLGGCELRIKDDAVGELSYWVFPQHRGHGYAARAVQLVVAHAFSQLGIERAEIHYEVDNAASRGVARRAGFVEEGTLRKKMVRGGQRRDLVITSRLKADWIDPGTNETDA
jgi:RimJ/RimL family protein N-acetyltransferase